MSHVLGRTSRFVIPAVVALSMLTAASVGAESEWRPGKYMSQAINRVTASVRRVTEKTQFGLDDGSSCFIAGYLATDKEIGSGIPLKAGVTYAIIGGGDDDVTDLDLYLKDSEGNIVARDVEKDSNPVIVFKPEEDGRYRVTMKLVSGKTTSSFCAYATLRDGGFDVPASNLNTAYERLITLCTAIDKKIGSAAFHDDEGEIALIGTILKEGETLTQSGIDIGKRRYVMCAATDGRASDLDLKLLDSDDDVVESDTADDATPILIYGKGGTMKLKITDVKSKGATLAMAAILRVGD